MLDKYVIGALDCLRLTYNPYSIAANREILGNITADEIMQYADEYDLPQKYLAEWLKIKADNY